MEKNIRAFGSGHIGHYRLFGDDPMKHRYRNVILTNALITIHPIDQILEFVFDNGSSHFHGGSQFLVIVVKFFIQDGESLYGFNIGQFPVDLFHLFCDQIIDPFVLGKAFVCCKQNPVGLSPVGHVFQFKLNQRREVFSPVPDISTRRQGGQHAVLGRDRILPILLADVDGRARQEKENESES